MLKKIKPVAAFEKLPLVVATGKTTLFGDNILHA